MFNKKTFVNAAAVLGINKSAVKKQELLKYTYLQQHVYSP